MARDELTQGMASTGHILLGNYTVNLTKGSTPVAALSCDPDLCPIGLDPTVHGGHTLGTVLGGCIPECTRMRGPMPSLIIGHSRDFHLESQTAMAHGDLTQGMARGGHILLGNHEIIRTDGATPVIRSYPVQARRVAKLDPTIESCLGQRHRQRNTMNQDVS